jgi:hypothetical protein
MSIWRGRFVRLTARKGENRSVAGTFEADSQKNSFGVRAASKMKVVQRRGGRDGDGA